MTLLSNYLLFYTASLLCYPIEIQPLCRMSTLKPFRLGAYHPSSVTDYVSAKS